MANDFNARARIDLDIRSFAQGAQAVTKSGGQMEKIFQNLNQVMGKVKLVEEDLASKLRTSLQVYNQISSAARSYASAVATLQKNEAAGASGAKLMVQAFQQLRSALAQVQGLSEKEYQRLSKTVALYERMAGAIQKLASAQKQMSAVTQAAITTQQKEQQAKQKAQETARKLALEEQKLELQREKLAQSAARAAQNEQKLALQREKLAQSSARMAQEEQRLAQARERMASQTSRANDATIRYGGSTLALRSSLGELEGAFRSTLQVVQQIPLAMASAAISQEKAFAQVTRVVGESEAEAAGLLVRFEQIAQQAPISFEEVANIGKLGAQIGIAASQLGDFTDTIVKFSLTTGVASEEATLLLGRIAQMQGVPISQMEQLGSAILALGTASTATDQEILRVNSSIATASNLFGLTAQETAGLSAALASLQVRPELSRGALTRVFNELATSMSEGGTSAKKLAAVMGMSNSEMTKLYNNPATRGDFLIAFIEGLSRAAGVGGDVQGVLRELGVNAVRDIDVFSRLANNVDIVKDSFDRANTEFARGNELNRQSKGIYETTSAELQNLGDAFRTLLASLGGPLAQGLGEMASILADILEKIAHLGPIVPVFGAIASVAVASGAAFLVFQIALSKTAQALIANKELQDRLGVSTLRVRDVYNLYKHGLNQTSAAQTVTLNTGRGLVKSTAELAATIAASERGMRSYAATAATAGTSLGAMSAASVNAARGLTAANSTALTAAARLQQMNVAGAVSAMAMTNVAAANRNFALTATQAAGATYTTSRQMALVSGSAQGLNRSLVTTTPLVTNMSNSMRNAASAGAAIGSGMRTTQAGIQAAAASSIVASGVFSTAAASAQKMGLAARGAALLMNPWTAVIVTAGLVLSPLIAKMFDFSSAADRLAEKSMESAGGIQGLANAIETDTDAAIKAAGSQENLLKIVKSGNQAALEGVGAYRAITVSKDNMSEADRRAAERAIAGAREQKRVAELTRDASGELNKQAGRHEKGAQAASHYQKVIDDANAVIDTNTALLGENVAVLGEQAKQWAVTALEATISNSKLADGSDISKRSLEQLTESGVNFGRVLETSFTNPQKATKQLDTLITDLNETIQKGQAPGLVNTEYGKTLISDAASAVRLRDAAQALKTEIESQSGEMTKSAIVAKLMGESFDSADASVGSLGGKVKITREQLAAIEGDSDQAQKSIEDLTSQFERLGTPMTAFEKAAERAFPKAEDAIAKFSLNSKSNLKLYLDELAKIATAQREWSANLIKATAVLGPEIAEQFRKLGPDAAPALKELVNLPAEELKKFLPQLNAIGGQAASELAAGIIKNSVQIKNASLQTRQVIADSFGDALAGAKTTEEFNKIAEEYNKLVLDINNKKVKVDISADNAKAIKSLEDLRTYISLVSTAKIQPKVAIDLIKARGDIEKISAIIKEAQASGKLDAKGKAALDTFLFQTQLTKLTTDIDALEAEGKLDAKGKGKLTDTEYRAKVLALTEFLSSTEGQGLLNPKGKSQLNNQEYIAQMQALAALILGKEQAGEFDANGDGKLNPDEFKRLLEALKQAVADANKGKLDPKGRVTLANTGGFRSQLNGIVQAAWNAGDRITNALSRNATVNVGYYYYQKNRPPSGGGGVANVATGGWINGPGGPKSDIIPAMLSNGEFVVNAAAAQRFGALLEVINRSGGRGFSGVAKRLFDSGLTGGNKQVRVSQGGSGTSMFGGSNMVQRVPPESVSVFAARMIAPSGGPTNVFNINNQYPQAEPTSVTINRSLAYAATISGV